MTKIYGTTSTCASPRALWTTTTSRSSETTSTSALFPVSPPLLFSSSSPTLWPPSYQDASLLSASQRNPSLTLSFSKILPSPLSPYLLAQQYFFIFYFLYQFPLPCPLDMAVVIFLSHAFLSLSLTIYGSFISLKRWAAQLPV